MEKRQLLERVAMIFRRLYSSVFIDIGCCFRIINILIGSLNSGFNSLYWKKYYICNDSSRATRNTRNNNLIHILYNHFKRNNLCKHFFICWNKLLFFYRHLLHFLQSAHVIWKILYSLT